MHTNRVTHVSRMIIFSFHFVSFLFWFFPLSFSSVSSTNFLGNGAQIGVLIDACRMRLFFMAAFIYSNIWKKCSPFSWKALFKSLEISLSANMRYFEFFSSSTMIRVFFLCVCVENETLLERDQKISA